MSENYSVEATLSADASQYQKAVSAALAAIENFEKAAGRSVDDTADKMQGMQKSVIKMAGSFVTAFAAVAGAKNLVGRAITRVDTIDTATKSLEVLTGDAKTATMVMEGLVKGIEGTPIALDQVALGAKKMVAAGMDGRKVESTFKAIADAAYGVGNGTESIDQMTDAIASMQSAGTVYADDINRLVDAGVPAWKILANQSKKSVTEMKKEVSSGALESNKAIEMLTEGIENGTDGVAGHTAAMAGLAKTAGDTISGSWANLQTAAVKIFANIVTVLKGPIISALTGLKDAFKSVAEFTASDAMKKGVESFVSALGQMISIVGSTIQALRPFAPLLKDIILTVLAMSALMTAQKWLSMFAIGVSTALASLAANPVLLFAIALGALVVSFMQAYRSSETFRKIVQKLMPLIVALAASLGTLIIILVVSSYVTKLGATMLIFRGTLAKVSKAIEALYLTMLGNPFILIAMLVAGLVAGFVYLYKTNEKFRNSMQGVISVLQAVGSAIMSGLGVALEFLIELFKKILPSLQAFGETVGNAVGAALQKVVPFFVSLGKALGGILAAGLQVVTNLFTRLYEVLAPIVGGILSTVGGLLDRLGGAFGKVGAVMGIAVGILTKVGIAFLGITGPVGIGISMIVSFLTAWLKTGQMNADGITKVFDDLSATITDVSTFLSENLPGLIDAGTKIILNIIEGMTAAIPGITTAITGIIESFTGVLSTALPGIIEAGTQMMTGLIDAIIQALPGITEAIQAGMTAYVETISTVLPLIIEAGTKLLTSLIEGIIQALPGIIDAVVTVIETLMTAFVAALPLLINVGLKILTTLIEAIIKVLPLLIEAAIQIVMALLNAIIVALPVLIEAGIQILMALIEGLIQVLPMLIEAAIMVIMALIQAIIDNIMLIVDAGIQLVMALIEGIIMILPALIDAAITLIMALIQAIIDNLPEIIDAGVQLIMALIEGLIQVLPQLVDATLTLIFALVDALIENAPAILDAGVKLVMALIDGLMQMLGKLLETGGKLLGDLLDKLGSFAKDMLDKGGKLISDFIQGVGSKAGELGSKALELGKNAVDSIKDGFSNIAQVGSDLIEGLWNGISDMAGWIQSKIQGFGKGVLDSLKDFFGIHSPSRLMRDQIGKFIPSGIAVGILGNAKQAKNAAISLAKAVTNAIDEGLSSKNKGEVTQAKRLAGIQSFLNKQTSQLVAIAKKRDSLNAQIKNANKKLENLLKESQKYASDIAKKMTDYASITGATSNYSTDGSSIDDYLKRRLQAIKDFNNNIKKLRSKGVSKNIIEDILNAGVEQGSNYARALAEADSKTIKSINSTQSQINSAAKAMGNTASDSMYKAGIDAAKGLVKGLNSQKAALDKSATAIGNSMVTAIKKALKIHSPSRVMRDEVGKFIPAGISEGMLRGVKDTVKVAKDLSVRVTDAFKPQLTTPEVDFDKSFTSASKNLANIDSTVTHEVNMNENSILTALKRIAEKQDVIVLDTGELVGATGDKYDKYLGNNTSISERLG
ncbi:tape measure protein [Listeria monocytogenes]|nr:tape measure protein [Listeria monocytogenes]EJN2614906.1 tape measure protein [Listeria monocytogenes]EJN2617954.1 tape measure protein [Listeria monocytogenes]ELB8840155.1 tape measure protein [Listeria monocytogenes]